MSADAHGNPLSLLQTSRMLAAQGRLEDALAALRAAEPQDAESLNELGLYLLRLGRMDEAATAFEQATILEPGLAQAHYRLGWVLGQDGRPQAARAAYLKTIALQPDHSDALAGLAALSISQSEFPEARDFARSALAAYPDHPAALLALIEAEIGEKNYARAQTFAQDFLAKPGIDSRVKPIALSLLADALDGQKNYDAAFDAYSRANHALRRMNEGQYTTERRALHAARALMHHFGKEMPDRWRPLALPPSPARNHVFIVGFPRSGTTLMEQVLASHPEVVTVEEIDAFQPLAKDYLAGREGLERLAALTPAQASAVREAYWARMRSLGADPGGKTFVDKLPMNMTKLPLIAKVFPDARIVFAVRDPRDIVLSCFRRYFEVNATTFEMLSLEDTAVFYDATMRLVAIYRKLLPLPVRVQRHEDLIADFDGQIAQICDFAGLPVHENLRAFSSDARKRFIRSPSAGQIRQGLNARGVGQWRNYAKAMQRVQKPLSPWVTEFGYDPDGQNNPNDG